MVLAPPEQFGHFLLLERLGQGATGVVHLARPTRQTPHYPPIVVVKRLHPALADKRSFVRRFRHEALIAVSVDSPHLAKIYGVGRVGPTYFIAMEYLAGWKAQRMLNHLAEHRLKIPLPALLGAVAGALHGLHALHEARHPRSGEPLLAVHRDLSPNNLIFGPDGALRIIDMGLGKSRAQDWQTVTGAVVGSLGYIAPEQILAQNVDRRSDIYSMAVILQELLTLRPFIQRADRATMLLEARSPRIVPASSIRSDVPARLDGLLARALSSDPDGRPATAEAFRTELLEVVPDVESSPRALGALVLGDPELARHDALIKSAAPAAEGHQASEDVTEIFAERTLIDPTRLVNEPMPRNLEPSTATVLPSRDNPIQPKRIAVYPPATPGPIPEPGTREHRPRGVPVVAVVALVCFAVLATLAIDRLIVRKNNVIVREQIAPAPVNVAPIPGARPMIDREQEPKPKPMTLPAEDVQTPARSKTRPRRQRRPEAGPRSPRSVAPAPQRAERSSLAEEVARITRRAQVLRQAYPHQATKIDAIVAEISLLGVATNEARARIRLRQASAQLERLAKTP